MRRAPLICALLAACLPAAAGARALPGAAAAGVRLTACVPALEQHERTATFEARVRQARGGERIQVRFTLQQREPASREWHRIVAEGLDEWQTSEAGVSRYSYAKTVQNLPAPAVYRVVVRFRWLDAGGTVLARARATSRGCRQPDMRPDLAATLIEPLPPAGAEPGGYLVILVNRG